jgi:hypothetical protein
MVSVNTLGRGHNQHIVTLIVSVLLLVVPLLPQKESNSMGSCRGIIDDSFEKPLPSRNTQQFEAP